MGIGNLSGIVHTINKSLHLTDDILGNTPIITFLGNKGVCIENYKKIKIFTDDKVVVDTFIGDVEIVGIKLYMECYYEDEVVIRGTIKMVDFNNGRE